MGKEMEGEGKGKGEREGEGEKGKDDLHPTLFLGPDENIVWLTESDVYDGRAGSKSLWARLWRCAVNDTVQIERNRRHIRHRHRIVCSERLQNVDAEKVTAMSGEVVIDSETRLYVERLHCTRLRVFHIAWKNAHNEPPNFCLYPR